MRRIAILACLVVVFTVQAAWCDSFESYQMDGVFLCKLGNGAGVAVDGLVLLFDAETESPKWITVGGELELDSMVDGRLVFRGSILPGGEFIAEWPWEGPRLIEAHWLVGDEVVERLCVSCPTAQIAMLPSKPAVGTQVLFRAAGSSDPDGLALERYLWEWSDGATAEGPGAERSFASAGEQQVSLTVWDAQGQSDTSTKDFVVGYTSEAYELQVRITVNLFGEFALPIEILIEGPGIYAGGRLLEAPTEPFFVYVELGTDYSHSYAAGTEVTLTPTASGVVLDRWVGCSRVSGNRCIVVMDADKVVEAYFMDSN